MVGLSSLQFQAQRGNPRYSAVGEAKRVGEKGWDDLGKVRGLGGGDEASF